MTAAKIATLHPKYTALVNLPDGSTITRAKAEQLGYVIETPRAGTPEQARSQEFAVLTGRVIDAEPVVATADAILRAGEAARSGVAPFEIPPQPRRTPLTDDERDATAKAIIAAGRKARGEPT